MVVGKLCDAHKMRRRPWTASTKLSERGQACSQARRETLDMAVAAALHLQAQQRAEAAEVEAASRAYEFDEITNAFKELRQLVERGQSTTRKLSRPQMRSWQVC